MQRLFTHIRNSDFHACDEEGANHQHAEVALAEGVQSAVALMADEIRRGRTSAAVEVSIEDEDRTQILCSIVAVCVSRLILRPQARAPLPAQLLPDAADLGTHA